MKKFSVLLICMLSLLASSAFGHEELSSDFDIHLTPLQMFQGDEVAIEAEVERNGTLVESLDIAFVIDKHDIGFTEIVAAKEREPGHYFIKYAFANSGPHEIHVEFVHEGEEIRKTIDISVDGRSLEIEQLFLVLAALVIALSAFYAMQSRRFKVALFVALLLLAVIGLSYSIYIVYTSGAAQRGVIVCTSANECYWSAHIHASAAINVCGDESYRFAVEKGPLNGPHTHEEKNLIHFHERLRIDPVTKEIYDPALLTLGAFFDAMEVDFSADKILDKTNGDLCVGPGTLKMFVNGKPSSAFRDYIWKDGDKIEIVFDERPSEAIAEEEQKATAQLTPELTLPIIIGFALIDSINPCVIGVLLLLITVLLKANKKRAILTKGSMYTLGVYVTYILGGVTLLSIFNAVRSVQLISQGFYVVVGAFVLIAAFLEIKDYFWYGRGFSLAIPKRFVKHIESNVEDTRTSLVSAFFFGSLVTLIELPCTGAPYLAIITMMSQSGVQFFSALVFLMLYNLIFVLPLLVIIYLAYKGIGHKKMEFWRKEHRGKMRLAVGLMLLGISAWIITTVLDWLLLPLTIGSIALISLMYIAQKIGQRRLPHRKVKKSEGKKA